MTREEDVLARTVYGEARGESDLGRLAVAYVACNRAVIAAKYVLKHGRRHPLYGGGTIAEACLVPYQFSTWNVGDVNLHKLLVFDLESDAGAPSLWAARTAINRTAPDPAPGSDHYCTVFPPHDGITWPPEWASKMTFVTIIGGHAFYREG